MLQLQKLFLLATLLPSALATTTVQAFLAPGGAAASVLAVADGATTYTIQCTQGCAANAENNQATLVNGPSTAGFTQIMADSSKTLIMDCKLAVDKKGDCTTKAISAGETRTGKKQILTFQDVSVEVTGGLEKLGYAVVETTTEVNTTVTARRTSKLPSATGTGSGTVSATLTGSGSSSSTDDASTTTRASSGAATITRAPASVAGSQTTSTSAGAAPTMKAEFLGGAIVGLAGILLAAL